MDVARYLRKSRAEDGMDTEEVLCRHRDLMDKYAAEHGLHIIETYNEVVSGESLYARPEMLRLLEDVEAGKYDAVLCMDLDRLSRGRMKDQGIVLDAFKFSDTKIITLDKVYDLSDEMDDELAEFKTFMSRREYKMINKRLRRGLRQTIQSGAYIANAPYGYRNVTVGKLPTLEIVEHEARFVRMMYEMYAEGLGCSAIATHISALGAKPHRGERFSRNSVRHILRNPTFTGKIVWDQKKHIRKGQRGNEKHITIYQPREEWTIVDGIHPPIIEKELYDKVQEIFKGRYMPPLNTGEIRSPLAGLVKCARCGNNMQRYANHRGVPYLLCPLTGCSAGAKFEFVETEVLSHLQRELDDLNLNRPQYSQRQTSRAADVLAALKKERASLEAQRARIYEFLENGVYDPPTFRERMEAVRAALAKLSKQEQDAEQVYSSAQAADPDALAERLVHVLRMYPTASPAIKNRLLKSVIAKVYYTKEKKTKPREFAITVSLRV